MYEGFAYIYDELMKNTDYEAWTDFIETIFKRGPYMPKTIVDLACGTGNITTILAKRGYLVTGIDISGDMLFAAREKSRKMGLNIPFICQDMTKLSLHKSVDAITCMCDGVNYILNEDDLKRFFKGVHKFLNENGLFVFDVSSYFKLSSILGNKTMADNRGDISFIWNNSFDKVENLLTMDLTFFIKEGIYYRRVDEHHIQRAYKQEKILELLKASGFSKIRSFGAFTLEQPKSRSHRIFFCAQKD